MIILENAELEFIQKYVKNADEILKNNDFAALIDGIDDVIIGMGYDDDWEFNDFGRLAQRIFDSVYYRNKLASELSKYKQIPKIRETDL